MKTNTEESMTHHYFVSYLVVSPDGLGAGMTGIVTSDPITDVGQLHDVRDGLAKGIKWGKPVIISYQLLRVDDDAR